MAIYVQRITETRSIEGLEGIERYKLENKNWLESHKSSMKTDNFYMQLRTTYQEKSIYKLGKIGEGKPGLQLNKVHKDGLGKRRGQRYGRCFKF